ncbi:MAG TPA: hypothetical protein VGR58_14235 [Candidatus Acidoferrum sp.]|nr:hypothetical protein [Candidatus Acidoferrum sp.]
MVKRGEYTTGGVTGGEAENGNWKIENGTEWFDASDTKEKKLTTELAEESQRERRSQKMEIEKLKMEKQS